jgi:glycogen debranching enzyme
VLIAAGDYFTSTGDTDFVRRNRGNIIRAANYYISRDFCGNGLFISHRDGNGGRKFGDTSIDTISSGYKNAWVNASTYKALLDAAQMLESIGEDGLPAFYRQRAYQLRQSFNRQFYDAETGLYYWWIGKNGVKHQYYHTTTQFCAVVYGLADFIGQDAGHAADARTVMRAMWREMCRAQYFDTEKQKTVRLIDAENGDYSNLYWGIPTCLAPVPTDYNYSDYGDKEFPYYCNGCSLPTMASLAIEAFGAAGMAEEAGIIRELLYKRQHEGFLDNGSGFYMGVTNVHGTGYSIAKWDGTPTDYEGIISRDCSFLETTLWHDEEAWRRLEAPVRRRPWPGAVTFNKCTKGGSS